MKLSTFGAVSAALALCAVAGAQTTPYQPIGASVRLGAFFPVNSSTSNAVGDGFFAFGADYRLAARTPFLFGLRSHLSASVDYFHHDDYGNIPVLLNYVADAGSYYFQVGAGVGFESLPEGDKTGFAYEVGVGYNVPTSSRLPVFLQAEFFGSDRSRVNGIGAFVGVRF